MAVAVIDNLRDLEALAGRLRGASRIALDLEGDGLFRYRVRLCTMQLRVDEETVIVDTLAAWDPALMAPVLGPDGPLKVIHDAAFDARLLRDHGVGLGHVFDTALAARYLGEPATGLSSLVGAHCGVKLDKGPQQADWGERPLSDAALGYLEADVAHLFALHGLLATRLDEAGIAAEYQAEVEYMLARALQPPAPAGPPWRRIKGGSELDPVGQAMLRELALVREEAARDADVPVFRILHDRVLLAIAQRKPRDARGLRAIRGALSGRAAGLQSALLSALSRGRQAGRVPDDESDAALPPPPSPEARAQRKARHAALTAWRRRAAAERKVDVQVVLPGHCLQDLAGWPPGETPDLSRIDGLGAVRIERDGETLVQVLADASPAADASRDGSR